MAMLFNTIFAFVIMMIAVFFGLHYYPAFKPQSQWAWIALFVVGTFCIVVAEAIVDNAGILKTWPKAQRLIFIVAVCSLAGIATLHYVAKIH